MPHGPCPGTGRRVALLHRKNSQQIPKKFGLPDYIKQALHIAVGWTAIGSLKSQSMSLSEIML